MKWDQQPLSKYGFFPFLFSLETPPLQLVPREETTFPHLQELNTLKGENRKSSNQLQGEELSLQCRSIKLIEAMNQFDMKLK